VVLGLGRPHAYDLGSIDSTWQLDAACRDEDPSLFFAPNTWEDPSLKTAREQRAKAICARCPVISECLSYALTSGEDAGVWGGLNEMERRRAFHGRAG
jgi:WhiB family redox-sensing transcriptional regulator